MDSTTEKHCREITRQPPGKGLFKYFYRTRNDGDNVLGYDRPSLRPSTLSRLNCFTYDLDIRYVG